MDSEREKAKDEAAAKMMEALEAMYEKCLSGEFFQDYDESSRLLGCCRKALSAARAAGIKGSDK